MIALAGPAKGLRSSLRQPVCASHSSPETCSALRERSPLRQRDRDLVEAHGVFKDQLVESLLPESRLRRGVSHRLGVWPGAVETREIAGPEEVAVTDFGHAPKTALFLDLEREENLALDELARLVGKRDVGLEDRGRWPAEIILTVEAPEHERHPTDAGLLEDKAHPGMAIADARENDRAHQFGHQ